MRHLYVIDDNGADYWVIAETAEIAIKLVLNHDDRDEYNIDEPPTLAEGCGVSGCTRERIGKTRYMLDGEEGECSMWFAYLIARDYGSGILACSEWP